MPSALSAGLRSQKSSREKVDQVIAKPCFYRHQDKSMNRRMKSQIHCPENHQKSGVRDIGRTSCRRRTQQERTSTPTWRYRYLAPASSSASSTRRHPTGEKDSPLPSTADYREVRTLPDR